MGFTLTVGRYRGPIVKCSRLTEVCVQSDVVSSRSYDPVARGFILKDVRYEKNKLYVLGLHPSVTKDCLLHYIEKISDYEVKHILWFKPHGRAIVTLDRDTTGKIVMQSVYVS